MSKIVIIGAGHVGSHCAYSLLLLQVCDELVLLDIDEAKARCHALDLADGVACLSGARVRAGGYGDCRDADIAVISAGAPRKPGQTRTDVMRDTVAVARKIAPQLRDSGFGGVVVCISNPADVIAHLFHEHMGLPVGRVFSTGTGLDTARLRRILAGRLGVAPTAISGYVLGEHGDAQVAAWSQVAVGGAPLSHLMQAQPGRYGGLDLAALADEARRTGTDVIEGKGATEFGIGVVLTQVVRAVLRDEGAVLPVSTLLRGEFGQRDVFAGVPAVVGAGGVVEIVPLALPDEELAAFGASCDTIRGNIAAAAGM